MNLFFAFILILILQRITELFIAKRNELFLKIYKAEEYDKSGYTLIVLMHTLFIISLITEFIILNKFISPLWYIILPLFIILQLLRYWIIISLGRYWNTKLIFLPSHPVIRKGPYKYFKHPNYFVVILEFVLIPLLFNCFITMLIFSVFNFIILTRRIKIENELLQNFGN